MTKTLYIDGKTIKYELEKKNIKNIYLRVKSDGTIWVTANKNVPIAFIEEFLVRKKQFIFDSLSNCEERNNIVLTEHFSYDELVSFVCEFCKNIFPYYAALGIAFPQIKFRRMVSRWGSCNPSKKIVTFNSNLVYAPKECVEYVVFHEFTHFLHADHSVRFYSELEKVCPDWKKLRKTLQGIPIRREK